MRYIITYFVAFIKFGPSKVTVMKKVTNNIRRGIWRGFGEQLEDLDFGDGICLLSQIYTGFHTKLNYPQREAELVGSKVNITNTNKMRLNARNNQT